MSIPEQVSTDLQGREDACGYKGIWTQKLLHCLSHFSSLIKYSLFVSLTLHLLQNALVEFDKRVQILLLLRDSKQCGGRHPRISKQWHRFKSGKEKEKHDVKDHKESRHKRRPFGPSCLCHTNTRTIYIKKQNEIFLMFFVVFFLSFQGEGGVGEGRSFVRNTNINHTPPIDRHPQTTLHTQSHIHAQAT